MSPIVEEIIRLIGDVKNPTIVYIGAPTFDATDAMETQTKGFADRSCKVVPLNLTDLEKVPSRKEVYNDLFQSSHAINICVN